MEGLDIGNENDVKYGGQGPTQSPYPQGPPVSDLAGQHPGSMNFPIVGS